MEVTPVPHFGEVTPRCPLALSVGPRVFGWWQLASGHVAIPRTLPDCRPCCPHVHCFVRTSLLMAASGAVQGVVPDLGLAHTTGWWAWVWVGCRVPLAASHSTRHQTTVTAGTATNYQVPLLLLSASAACLGCY